MPQFIFNVENDYPQVLDLEPTKITIGKARENDIALSESSVSAFHAELNKEESGSYSLENLSVFNGTVVNDELVSNTVSLKDGDRIKLGGVTAIYINPEEDSEELNRLQKLIQREEIERNKLEQHEDNAQRLRSEIEQSLEKRKQLQTELAKLSTDSETIKTVLNRNTKESGKLAKVIADAKAFKSESKNLSIELAARKKIYEELNGKITALENSRAELKLEEAVKQKQELIGELANLGKQIETSKVELEKNRLASAEAAEIFEKSQKIEAIIREQEQRLKDRKTEAEKFEAKISEQKKALHELDLDGAIKQKQTLTSELDQLGNWINTSQIELKSNKREAAKANAIFEKSKVVAAAINEQEQRLQQRKIECGKIEAKVADLEVASKQKEALAKDLDLRNEKLEGGIATLETALKTRKNESEHLAKQIDAREKTIEELGNQITVTSRELKNLETTVEGKQREADNLAKVIAKNEGLVRQANERLAEVEAKVEKGLEVVSQSKAKHLSLEDESSNLTRIVGEKSAILERIKAKVNLSGITESACPPIRLINPGLSSLVHYFNRGAGRPGEEKFEPIGINAFAACTKGSIHRDADSIMSADDPVLLSLTGDIIKDKASIESVRVGFPNVILLACMGEAQLKLLGSQQGQDINQILSGVTGIVSTDPEAAKYIEHSNITIPHTNLPAPIPIEYRDWNLSVPVTDRTRGIFINADGIKPLSRIHKSRIEFLNQVVARSKASVTIYQQDSTSIDGFEIPTERLLICKDQLSYRDYLKLMAQHRLAAGFCETHFGTAVGGDALITRNMYIGANRDNITDQLLFADTCITVNDSKDALQTSPRLLTDNDFFQISMERSQDLAVQLISFESVGDQLNEFIHSLPGK